MNTKMNLKKSVTTIIGAIMFFGGIIIWRVRENKLNREIDEFDRIMQELKIRRVEHGDCYRNEACERKEVTRCCQIR